MILLSVRLASAFDLRVIVDIDYVNTSSNSVLFYHVPSKLWTYVSQKNLYPYLMAFLLVFVNAYAIRLMSSCEIYVCYGHILVFYFKKPRFQVQSTVAPHKCGIGQLLGRAAECWRDRPVSLM